jgi:xylulose-5-phosphate/fructose-6-phosphate phosphoketolase
MPGEVIDQPNPPPLPSHLPDSTLELAVKVDKTLLSKEDAQSLKDFQRAACYIAGCKYNISSAR